MWRRSSSTIRCDRGPISRRVVTRFPTLLSRPLTVGRILLSIQDWRAPPHASTPAHEDREKSAHERQRDGRESAGVGWGSRTIPAQFGPELPAAKVANG